MDLTVTVSDDETPNAVIYLQLSHDGQTFFELKDPIYYDHTWRTLHLSQLKPRADEIARGFQCPLYRFRVAFPRADKESKTSGTVSVAGHNLPH